MVIGEALVRWAACVRPGPETSCAVGTTDWVVLLGMVAAIVMAACYAGKALDILWTLRAMAWMSAVSRILSRWVKARAYSAEAFYRADGAAEPWARRREEGLERLARRLREQYPASIAWAESLRDGFSDLRFTDANRVPLAFAGVMRERFNLAAVVTASDGPHLQDLDGHWTLDVGGSYGVNVAEFARYKAWMARGLERVRDLGPVLGPLHPVVAENVALLGRLSGLDEVSFHMSGTEAVMAAVRLARFNTRRRLIVAFAGAYHGWWDGVQPGLGSERPLDDCLTLRDIPAIHVLARPWTAEGFGPMAAAVAREWFLWTLLVVAGRVLYLVRAHDLRLALVWFVKLVTDPLTDIIAYSPRYLRRA